MNDLIDIGARHHLRLRTDESGHVTEVPLIDGKPFPGIRKLALYAETTGRPAIALIQLAVEIDYEGDTVIEQFDVPDADPPEAA